MSKFRLAFGIHNHQPVGNFPEVFEQAHRDAYAPFLDLIASSSCCRLSLHQSGILWNWQKENHPEYLEKVRELIAQGRLELMTGGFYEPILTSIPQRDARGQIGMMNRFLQDEFGVKAEGLWLTERIWEPHLPNLLSSAGVKHLPIDDTHFVYAGLDSAQLTGPFITEDEGHTVTLLPIRKQLRYLIPFGTIEKLFDYLKKQADANPDGVTVYADDGEKFGVWPNTHQHCYDDGWLYRFAEAIDANSDWLEVVPLSVAAAVEPAGRAYLPTASYEEMLHWALPVPAYIKFERFEKWLQEAGKKDEYGRFVRGGHWRGFLSKYDESNLMHKKMLRVSDLLAESEQSKSTDSAELANARDRLYASQCNCPYWHGVFGGLYLPHIRRAVYGAMIEAEDALRRANGQSGLVWQTIDYDCDGHDEIICSGDDCTAVFKPNRGGTLLDLSLVRQHFDLTDTLSRRKEGYHSKLDRAVAAGQNGAHESIHDLVLAKEEGLSELLAEDTYLKRCFIDHFLSPETDAESFQSASFEECGDFVTGDYTPELNTGDSCLRLSRNGIVRQGGKNFPVQLNKSFRFRENGEEISVEYELSTTDPGGLEVNFAVENNFNFQAGHADDRYIMVDGFRPPRTFLDSTGEYTDAHSLALVDQYNRLAVAVAAETPADIWHCPIFTVSLSEGGFEKVYQGTTIVHRFTLTLTERPTVLRFRLVAGGVDNVLAARSAAGVTSD